MVMEKHEDHIIEGLMQTIFLDEDFLSKVVSRVKDSPLGFVDHEYFLDHQNDDIRISNKMSKTLERGDIVGYESYPGEINFYTKKFLIIFANKQFAGRFRFHFSLEQDFSVERSYANFGDFIVSHLLQISSSGNFVKGAR